MSGGRPLLVWLTGPSGVGKDSVLLKLRDLRPDAHFAITATTRPPRAGERNAVDYYFLTPRQFREKLERGELLEHATVYKYEYGVPKAPIREALAAGKDVLLRTDVQGARYIKSVIASALTIFISPPSLHELERRLLSRAADDPKQTELRVRIAEAELAAADEFDYVVVNDDLEECAAEILDIMEQERCQQERTPVSIQ